MEPAKNIHVQYSSALRSTKVKKNAAYHKIHVFLQVKHQADDPKCQSNESHRKNGHKMTTGVADALFLKKSARLFQDFFVYELSIRTTMLQTM